MRDFEKVNIIKRKPGLTKAVTALFALTAERPLKKITNTAINAERNCLKPGGRFFWPESNQGANHGDGSLGRHYYRFSLLYIKMLLPFMEEHFLIV